MAIRRAGGGGLKKRKKKGAGNLQGGIFEGRAGAYAFGEQPDVALGEITDRANITGPSGGASEYDDWRRRNTVANLQNQYAQALAVNKALTYPEFLSQTYGTQLGGSRLVGRKGHKRRLTTPFAAGNLERAADPYDFAQYTEEFNPEYAYHTANEAAYRGMSAGTEDMARRQAEDMHRRYMNYKANVNPAQDWGDFVNGVTTAVTNDYDPTAYGYHAHTGGGGGGRKRKKGKR